MARRGIGQEVMGFVREERRGSGLDELSRAIDWAPLDHLMRGIYAAEKGERGWPPLALFKGLLLAVWHDLSDVALAEAMEDRASFRRFCGFSSSEATPERTAFVRFRAELLRRRLDERLFRAVVRQLDDKGLTVRTGTLVDATVIRAGSKGDGEAGWCVYGGPHRSPVKGYKAHVATDEEGGIVRRVAVTAANVPDAQGMVLPRDPGRVWADAGYDSHAVAVRIRKARGEPRVIRRLGLLKRPALAAARKAWNAAVRPVRCRIEKVFGTAKRSYGLAQARYLGLRKTALQVNLTFLAYNLRRAATLLRPESAR